MEEPEMAKEWYVTHEGKQFGPVSLDDLKYEAERGELNPRLDMVWKAGMEDWMPAGDLEAIFEKNKEAEKKEDAGSSFSNTQPEEIKETKKKRVSTHGKWGGASRSSFIFLCYIFPILWVVGIAYGATFLQGKFDEKTLGMATMALFLVPVIISLVVVLQRFRNLGMTGAWFLGLIVPILNWWLGYRLIACPEGYAEHKKLDGIGWVLAILYWLPFAAVVLAGVFAAVVLSNSGSDDPYRVAIESYIHKIEEMRPLHISTPAE
jgi:uncharacterized membrane protein YhaH (DUF805 family)